MKASDNRRCRSVGVVIVAPSELRLFDSERLFTPPAYKSRQRLHRRLRRIQVDPFVRVVRVAAARAEQKRRSAEVPMEDKHIAWPADAADQRLRARHLPEGFGKLSHNRMLRLSRRAG